MKIEDKRNEVKKQLKFKDLAINACFEWATDNDNEGICIKLDGISGSDDYYSLEKECGYESDDSTSQNVVLLNATLVINKDD